MTALASATDSTLRLVKNGPRRFPDHRVYVVSNWPGGGNDRVKKILRLREQFDSLVLVSPGDRVVDDAEVMMAPRITNPLGLLRKLGLNRLKLSIERYLYFPSMDVLFTYRIRRRLANRIASDLAAGKRVTLLTTAPPHALGLIGLYVKRRCPGVRWVLDWQDLWSYDENYYLRAPLIYRPRVHRQERAMLAAADLNLTTNSVARDILETRYKVPTAKLAHINHHFDRSDFLPVEHEPPDSSTIKIGFLGALFKPPRVPGAEVASQIQMMRDQGLDVELHVHGLASQSEREAYKNSDAVHLHGWVSHQESVSKLAEYDYLLLLLADLPNCRAVMSIKLPHYMVTDKPILAIVPEDSAIAEIVHETGTGVVLPVTGDWRSALQRIVEQHHNGSLELNQRNASAIEAFSWARISNSWIQAIVG